MNYLAHLFLATPEDEHRIGSLLADFTNGTIDSLSNRYGEGIARGIRDHRLIDRYTDNSPAVKQGVSAISDLFGIYSGIVVDVVFDHFLLRYWEEFSKEKEESFFESVYRSLSRRDWDYPGRYEKMVQGMLERKWLDVYYKLEKVAFALKKIDERFPRRTPLEDALYGIEMNYSSLEKSFLTFFPGLLNYRNSELMEPYSAR